MFAKGYCLVCESFVSKTAGELCPKHLVELEAQAPPRMASRLAKEAGAWVEVGRYSDALACQPPRIRLEAEGIPTIIDGERMGDRSMYQVATGGVGLRVPANLAGEARIILSQTWTADAAALDIDEWTHDEDFEPLDPTSDPSFPLLEDHPSFLTTLFIVAAALGLVIAALVVLGRFQPN